MSIMRVESDMRPMRSLSRAEDADCLRVIGREISAGGGKCRERNFARFRYLFGCGTKSRVAPRWKTLRNSAQSQREIVTAITAMPRYVPVLVRNDGT